MSYNGYTDYATWRVNMDLFSNIEFTKPVTADDLIEMAGKMVFDNYEMKQGSHNVEDYARAFLALPNYNEIANLINEEMQEDKQSLSDENIGFIATQMDLKMWESFNDIVQSTVDYEEAIRITDKDVLLIKEKIKEFL